MITKYCGEIKAMKKQKMRISQNFVVYNMNEETLLVPTAEASFHGLGEGNKTVGVILNCLTKGTTEEEIVDALAAEFDGNRKEMAEDVRSVIAKLKSMGAIFLLREDT